jgi:Fe-S cluster biosynthesis and repair protein YggX
MPLLQVQDIPGELYNEISRTAQVQHRSIAQQTIVLLKNGLNSTEERMERRKAVLREIDKLMIENPEQLPDPAELNQEDKQ